MTGARHLRNLALLALVLLGACAPRGAFELAPSIPEAAPYPVLMVTDRMPTGGTLGLSTQRAQGLSIFDLTVTVPPTHTPGKIAYPADPVDPSRSFVVTQAARTTIGALSNLDDAGSEPVMVYVHGYNNTPAEAVYRQVQMSHDFGLQTSLVTFAWTSAELPVGYVHDRDSVLVARNHFEVLLREIAARQGRDIQIVAHSMGAMLVMETLRQMRLSGRSIDDRISGIVFISPDIDMTVFRAQFEQAAPMPEPFAIFVSQNDRALRLSSRLSGQQARLGAPEDLLELQQAGIIVVDLSNAKGGSVGGHFEVATSPTAIALIRSIQTARIDFEEASESEVASLIAHFAEVIGLR
jgi:esterase/lipase superfamily enzyme